MPTDPRAKNARRLASERNSVTIDRAAPLRFALAFPNVYKVGMASLGFQLVYRFINDAPSASCERIFLPDPEDLAELTRSHREILTFETGSPLSTFDVVAFSISFEMDYLNVLRILDLARIPVESARRDESHPLIIAGGPCPTFNAEPLADFIDAFVIGDAEETLPMLVNALDSTQGRSRSETLENIASLPGVYVPAFYHPHYTDSGELASATNTPPAPEKVIRAITHDLTPYASRSVITTPEAEFGEAELVEVSRGCGWQCRFCAAGYTTRPPRPRRFRLDTEARRLGLIGAAVFDHPEAESICRGIIDAGKQFTISSVRLETVTPALAALMAAGGQKTLTIAPETAGARLRAVINKNSSDEQIFSAVSAARRAGIDKVKLYFMLGLPTETDEDASAISGLIRGLSAAFPAVKFHVSVNSLVPKPWTPFQWHPMERESVLRRRHLSLRKDLSTIPRVKLSGESPRLAMVQALLARGDRRMGALIAAALTNGGNYPAAIRETRIDVEHELYRAREVEEVLPWDHVDVGIDKRYLAREYDRALKQRTTPPCDTKTCTACGLCK